ncbi:MAG: terminase gpA endonuclease subunit [Pirellulaceae bacterium]
MAPAKWDETALDGYELASRVLSVQRGVVPADAQKLTMGIDLGKHLCHWALVAWSDGERGHVVDYGRVEVPSRELGVEQALLHALRELRDQVLAGWPRRDAAGQLCVPDAVWIDAGYMTDVVYRLCQRRPSSVGARMSARGLMKVGGPVHRREKDSHEVAHFKLLDRIFRTVRFHYRGIFRGLASVVNARIDGDEFRTT